MGREVGPLVELDALLQQCRAGDELAWEALVRRYQGRVFALTYHYLRDREEARDVAQETFIRIYRGLQTFDGSGSFLAWTARIARNCAFDRMRKLKSSPAYAADEMQDHAPPVEPGPSPETMAASHSRRDLVHRAMERMSEINREMILLKEIQGLKQREIADILALPIGTVKARTNRARLELASRILELDPTYGAAAP
jgi:RNA polymerase sigma-70 factor (ECF subfamily)